MAKENVSIFQTYWMVYMKVLSNVRYALRLLVDIVHKDTSVISSRSIAESEGFSVVYIRQLLMQLRNKKIIKTVRGRKGGITLAKDPVDISVYDIYCACSGHLVLSDCLTTTTHCKSSLNQPCRIHDVWERLNAEVVDVLKRTTLADILREIKE